MPRQTETDGQRAYCQRSHMDHRSDIEAPYMQYEQVGDNEVEKAPKHIYGRGREPFSWWLCKGALEGTAHGAADKMRDSVCQESATEEVRHEREPLHVQALLAVMRSLICCVEPVSPSRGKTCA